MARSATLALGTSDRRLWTLVVFAIIASACVAPKPDIESRLPRSVGGVEIEYNRTDRAGLEADSPAHRLAAALGSPAEDVTFLRGYRDVQGDYNSDIFQVGGADTAQLLEAAIAVYGMGAGTAAQFAALAVAFGPLPFGVFFGLLTGLNPNDAVIGGYFGLIVLGIPMLILGINLALVWVAIVRRLVERPG